MLKPSFIFLAAALCTIGGRPIYAAQTASAILPPMLPRIGERGMEAWRDLPTTSTETRPETQPAQVPRHSMLIQYLLNESDLAWQRWERNYEQLRTAQEIAENQKRLRARFIEALGGFPERTPLEPRTVGVIRRDGYRVEKVVFQSQPKLYVTAAVFVPDDARFKPPYPGVIVPCGHTRAAKGWHEYQSMGALLALSGMVACVFDPIEQGERCQLPQTQACGTAAHDQVGVGSILLGRSTATFEIWDGMRAIDYLQSRPEVDPKRIGCTGNSGGGTQTSYLMALDQRIIAAAPSCYVSRMGSQIRNAYGDAEQQIFGQLAWGMDHPDYLTMQAPEQAVLILAATDDFFDINATWRSLRLAKRLYTRLGCPERIDMLENDAGHNYNKSQREGAARWMSRWLLGRDTAIVEPTLSLIPEKEILCTPDGNVMRLEGARTTYDLNEDLAAQLAKERSGLLAGDREKFRQRVREITGIRRLEQLPEPKVEVLASIARPDYGVEKLIIHSEPGIYLPALFLNPGKDKPAEPVLYLGKANAALAEGNPSVQSWLREGRPVLAVDVRGTGETAGSGDDWSQGSLNYRAYYTAYMLGRSLVAIQAEDILICGRYLAGRSPGMPRIELVAAGPICVAAMHAAAMENSLFASIRLQQAPASWMEVIRARPPELSCLAITVQGALRAYDWKDLSVLVKQQN